MSKLLVTRLPLSIDDEVKSNTFNRLVRVLELNLGEFDPDNTRQINDDEKSKAQFNTGSLIWNTNNECLEVWSGTHWIQLHTPQNDLGFQGNGYVGNVDVKTNGDITIDLGGPKTGWDIEAYYT
tara:strand:+ start:2637 stop:3008 length:372 start_codon:yes stop_codon:yes gene_type:complete